MLTNTHRNMIQYHIKSNIHRNRKIIKCNMDQFPLTGLDVGIPLNLIENIFTELHYGENIITIKHVIIQFLIGYYTYGKDRYIDALEYNNNITETKNMSLSTKKKELYKKFNNNKVFYKLSYDITLSLLIYLILTQQTSYEIQNQNINIQTINYDAIPFIFLLYSSEYYRELKRVTPLAKSLYVSFMWTISTIILPSYLYEHNYNIIYDATCYLPCLLTLFATTNIADIKDIEEDTINKVKTLPVTYGVTETKKVIFLSLMMSSIIFGLNTHYIDNPIFNTLFELQNIGLTLLTQNITEKI